MAEVDKMHWFTRGVGEMDKRRSARLKSLALLVGFAAAVSLRVGLGGHDVSRSRTAGLSFAACLLLLTVLAGTRWRVRWVAAVAGLGTGIVLCLPAIAIRLIAGDAHRPAGSFLVWAAVVVVVAVAEEGFLRGALRDSLYGWLGVNRSILVTSACFGLLHVPLYGWVALPLDLAVGIILGLLREATGSPAAPAVAHVTADLVAWWLR